MSVRQGRASKTSDSLFSIPTTNIETSSPSTRTYLSKSSLVKIILVLLIVVGSLVLSLDYVVAEAESRENALQLQLAICKEREDRVWNLGYEAGEKLGMYRVSIEGRDGESEAWAAWKEGFKAGEELGKRGVCERFRY